MVNFSLVFATRKRPDLLEGLFKSLLETTKELDKIEVMPVCDNDDHETINHIKYLETIIPSKFLIRERSSYLNRDYINYAASMSKGKYIFILNDDVLFQTKDWDEKSLNELENYLLNKPDRIVYGMTDDGMDQLRTKQNLQYAGFPIISREAFNSLGYAMYPEFKSWGADTHLYRIFEIVNRILNIKRQCMAFHLSPHTQTREKDEINLHVASIHNNINPSPEIEANKLRNIINQLTPNSIPHPFIPKIIEPQKIIPTPAPILPPPRIFPGKPKPMVRMPPVIEKPVANITNNANNQPRIQTPASAQLQRRLDALRKSGQI